MLALLSPREKDCLRLVFENHSSKEIARRLGISQTSVDTHIRHARSKLGLRDRYEAARLLRTSERGLLRPEPPEGAAETTDPALTSPRPVIPFLRPLDELSYPDRLLLVAGCAIGIALVFGLLLPALAAI